MYNILLIENSLQDIEKIINTLSEEINYVKICNVASSYLTASKFLLCQKFDILIINYSFFYLLNFIEKNNLYMYKNSIIILNNNNKSENCNNLYCFNSQIIPFNELINSLKQLIHCKNNSHNVRLKIRNELTYLNYNYSYNGTHYIEDVIFELYKIKNNFKGNLKKERYPILSKKYNKSIDTIYGDIKVATKYMILDCKEEIILKYFNFSFFIVPKVKEIILPVLNKL